MASNRSDELRAIVVECVQIQLASLNAGIEFWRGWVDRASEFAQSAARDLKHLTDSKTDLNLVVGRLTDTTRSYLRRITELPDVTAAKFNQELKNVSTTKKSKHTRAARAKE